MKKLLLSAFALCFAGAIAAQELKLVDTPEADEVYTREWALNTAAVTKLLLGD